jgi:glutathione synthase/RimK-type ligase-like ATP-grasp enzyme
MARNVSPLFILNVNFNTKNSMKKIGILFGQENTFPQAFIDRINEKKINGIMAEAVMIDKVMQADPTEYAVIIDRISQDVPFYRAYLKNAAISGTAVLNNPFWWSADEKFFNNALAIKTGVPVPKTVLLPSKDRPDDTTENSFRNLKYPMDWDGIFEHIGFPAYMKPFAGGGWKNVYKLNNADEFFKSHGETGQLIMMLQEEIVFSEYFRCYCLGGNEVRIMQYEPRNPHHLRYVHDGPTLSKKLLDTVKDYTIKLNAALGYDFNTVEFAVRDGIPYAIDFCNPAPDADINSVGQENFDWVVETAANMAIKKAQEHKPGQMNLTWGTFVKNAVAPSTKKPAAKKAPTKKAAPAVKTPVAKTAPTKAKKAVATTKTTTAKKTTAAKQTTTTKAKTTAPVTKKPVKKATTTKRKSK